MTGLGGGVGCYIRSDLVYRRRPDLETPELELMFFELPVKLSKPILMCVLYRPPDSSKHLNKSFNERFADVITLATLENKETSIVGDINCDYLNKSSHKEKKQVLK